MDLQTRPIHHRLENRGRVHVLLCMLAYYVEWHMRKEWEPLLFDGEPQGVSNGKRRARRYQEGYPVMSFHDLLADLKGLTRNRALFQGAKASVTLYSTPSPLQQPALDLLSISHTQHSEQQHPFFAETPAVQGQSRVFTIAIRS